MTHDNDSWDACPVGQVTNMVKSLRQEKQQAITKQLAMITGSLAIGFVIVAGIIAIVNQSPTAKIGCDEVIANMDEYRQELLSTELAARIQVHLTLCPSCKQHYEAGAGVLKAAPVEVSRHRDAIETSSMLAFSARMPQKQAWRADFVGR